MSVKIKDGVRLKSFLMMSLTSITAHRLFFGYLARNYSKITTICFSLQDSVTERIIPDQAV